MTTLFNDWTVEDRPAEKLMLRGHRSLTNAELLSIMLNTDLDKAKIMLALVGNDIRKLAGLSVREVLNLKVRGVGKATAIALTAAFELGQRRLEQETYKPVLISSRDVADFLKSKIQFLSHEVFICLYLNRANKVKHYEIVSEGGMTGTVVDPRVILRKSLEHHATGLVLCHNHPSGSIKPSKADETLTTKIKEAASYFDIKVLDHVIVSEEGYYSFADEGLL